MRKNRKRTKEMSVVASRSMHIGAIIMMLFVVGIIYLLASSSCDQLSKSIGEKEKVLAKLEKDRQRASAAWDAMKTSENLDRMLRKHGLAMKYAHPHQVVRINRDGKAIPGQLSLTRISQIEQRNKTMLTANYPRRR